MVFQEIYFAVFIDMSLTIPELFKKTFTSKANTLKTELRTLTTAKNEDDDTSVKRGKSFLK